MTDLDTLLANPALRPVGGWSVVAEAWAEDRDTADWRAVGDARRLRRDLALERQEVADLTAELHARAGAVPL